MSFIKIPGVQVVDWPGRSFSFDYRTAVVFTEQGMEREAFYACINPTTLLKSCTKHPASLKRRRSTPEHLSLF